MQRRSWHAGRAVNMAVGGEAGGEGEGGRGERAHSLKEDKERRQRRGWRRLAAPRHPRCGKTHLIYHRCAPYDIQVIYSMRRTRGPMAYPKSYRKDRSERAF